MKQRAADLGSKESPQRKVLPCVLASFALLFGVLGLLDGSWTTQILGSRAGLHALFGLFLYTLVAVRFHGRLHWAAPASQCDIRRLSRDLSRMVYLSLYAIIGLGQIGAFVDGSRHGGIVEFGRLPDADIQAVVAYGIAGLLLIRVLAFGTWLHAARGAAAMAGGAALVIASDRNLETLPRPEA